jgi:hypothetical protein
VAEDTKTTTVTILDVEFPISMPYAEGHVLTGPEAKVLNQTRKENLSNNFRKNVQAFKDGGEGAMSETELQEAFAELDTNYVFNERTAAAATKFDPVEKEARSIARDLIRQAASAQGLKVKDLDQDEYEAKIAEVAAMDEVIAQAKKIVKQKQSAASITLEGLGLKKAEGEAVSEE